MTMTLIINVDDRLRVTNEALAASDNNYYGRAAKLAILENLADELISDEILKTKVGNYCQENIEKSMDYII